MGGAGSTGGAGRQLTYEWTLKLSGADCEFTCITDDTYTGTEKAVFLSDFADLIEVETPNPKP